MSLTLKQLEHDLHTILFPGGIAASMPHGGFGLARFTRDSLTVMDNLLRTHPELVRQSFSMIPQEQGMKYDDSTDEQPDRLPHQVAYNSFGGIVVPQSIVDERRRYADTCGIPFDEAKGFVIWNQTDASRYVSLLKSYVDKYGRDILDDQFIHRPSGEKRTVREAALRQLDWMVRTIQASDLGLLEVKETNPKQTSWSGVMRDGYDSYFHENADGTRTLVNKNRPIAYIESQGLAVTAFEDAIELFKVELTTPEIRSRIEVWRSHLHRLPNQVWKHFWWEAEGCYVPAVDRDKNNKPRQVRMMSSVIGETLATPALYSLISAKKADSQAIIARTVELLESEEFMTPLGIRMQGKRHARTEGEVYAYQGSRAIWPVTQWRIADGLEKNGYILEANDLRRHRVLAGLAVTPGEYPEIWFITDDNLLLLHEVRAKSSQAERILSEQSPAAGQAWTMTGAYKALAVSATKGQTENVSNGKLSPTFEDSSHLVRPYWIDVKTARQMKSAH